MTSRTSRVATLLFGSGFCALVYQTAWLREFRLIFGASTLASAAVLAIFIGGLGAGSLILGPRADRHPRPLLFYAALEAIIAISAALTPLLILLARAIYLASGGAGTLGTIAATVERLILSVLVLSVPTIAMGGTLPAAARAVTSQGDVRRQRLSTLYALNTIGAVAGCLAATFFLLEIYGTRATIWLAAAVNILVAVSARVLDRANQQNPANLSHLSNQDNPDNPENLEHQSTVFVTVAAAAVGFAFFLMELVWYRLLAPLLGGSVFTFGLVLAVALAGIGLGGLLYSLASSDRPASLSGFAASCLLEALAVAATFALGDRVAILALAFIPLNAAGFTATVAGWTIVTAIVVLPPAVIAGYQFPLLIALFGRGRERIGHDVGVAYAANTLGAIAGSLAGGFGLLPWLSATGAWQLVAVMLASLGVAAALHDNQRKEREDRKENLVASDVRSLRALRLPLFLTAAIALLLAVASGPTAVWRHGGIGAGRAVPDVFASASRLRAWENGTRHAIVWQGDGVESSVALGAQVNGYAFIVNGKSDGSARADAGTQVMLGLLGAIRHPQPKRALVIGLGTGSTAGWLGAVPSIERVDAIELEPLVLDVARASQAVNHDVMHNPKVRITIGDARETLLTTRDRYDVIASEPSNPFRAGIASLFTVEYYRAARARLTDEGVFAQWVQGYEIDAPTLRTIYATLAAVFPQVETWQTNHGDLVLLASARPRGYTAAALRARIAEEPYRTALQDTWRAVDLDGFLAHYLATDAVARALASSHGAEVNTDDRNLVEFGLARSVGRSGSLVVAEIRALAGAMNASHPPLDADTGVSWPAAETAWANFVGWDAQTDALRASSGEEQIRREALRLYYSTGDIARARDLWHRLNDRPRDPSELAMAADLEADAGSEAARPLIEQLRRDQPAEADILLATLLTRQLHFDEATTALVTACVRLRDDPWPQLRFKEQALTLAAALGRNNPGRAGRLFDALRQPFSVKALDETRLLTAATLTTQFDFRGRCKEPIGAFEPDVPWTADFLILRRDCYQASGDARLEAAVHDLNAFAAQQPAPLAPR
jgi:spermidine synthase